MLAPLSTGLQSFTPIPTIKLGPSGACAHSRPLWVSPTTSPVRLGVSPAAAPTPRGAFNQRFEALFPGAGALGCAFCFAPHHSSSLSMFECGAAVCYTRSACPALCHSESGPLGLYVRQCGAAGSASARTAWALLPTLCQSGSRHSQASPLHPGARLRPSYWSGCMFLVYLLGVGLSCR